MVSTWVFFGVLFASVFHFKALKQRHEDFVQFFFIPDAAINKIYQGNRAFLDLHLYKQKFIRHIEVEQCQDLKTNIYIFSLITKDECFITFVNIYFRVYSKHET